MDYIKQTFIVLVLGLAPLVLADNELTIEQSGDTFQLDRKSVV